MEAASEHFSTDEGIECHIYKWELDEYGRVKLYVDKEQIADGAAAIAEVLKTIARQDNLVSCIYEQAVQEFVHPKAREECLEHFSAIRISGSRALHKREPCYV